MANNVIYNQERVFIATRHRKELVIAPIFQQVFDAKPFVSSFIDTDQFGTFTREIERKDDPLATLKNKCEYGSKVSGCSIVIASEGSFGAHPSIPFTSANEEIVMFKDFKNSIEITGRFLSTETNLFEQEITSTEEYEDAINKIMFPSHGIVLKDLENNEVLLKSEFNYDKVTRYIRASLKSGQKLLLSSDMRALYNPTRMKNIEEATKDLVKNIKSHCPDCGAPGFVVTDFKPGLPCSNCGMPTKSVLYSVKKCQNCNNQELIKYPKSKQLENPMYCDFCNP